MFNQSFSYRMNRTQNTSIMKTHIYIFALLVAAITLLSSCSLLVASPIHSHGPHPHYAPHEEKPLWSKKICKKSFQVPIDGGIYEFECANDEFYISRIFDSSMLMPETHTNYRYSPTTDDYLSVDDLSYYGPFYTITCDLDKHNWIIKVDPLTATPGEFSYRDIWVFMWDGSDDYHFVFQFEQYENDSFEGIE